MAFGKYIPAIKSCARALELQPSLMLAKLVLGQAKLAMGTAKSNSESFSISRF
jgi:predicted Zn-dependent protease